MSMSVSADKFYTARIIERRDLSDDLWVIRVDPGGEYCFEPGQYATLGIVAPEKHYERAYSIVSAPHEKLLEFFIELVPQGSLTPQLYPRRIGEELTLRKVPRGRFTLDTSSGRPNHLLLATVTGVAPFVSYARSLRHQSQDANFAVRHKLYLLEGASRSWEFGYREELEQLAAEVPWLVYVPTISRAGEEPSWNGETGRVDDLIRKYTDSWGLTPENTTAYLCGNPSMIDIARGILKRRGWQRNGIKQEAFFVQGMEPAKA
jgi:ferredoxin/flavodoxin---NADP+ reductase